jgi:hypothetical protein
MRGAKIGVWLALALGACSDSGSGGSGGGAGGAGATAAGGGGSGGGGAAGAAGSGASSGGGSGAGAAGGAAGAPGTGCAPLPKASGAVVQVTPSDTPTLHEMVQAAGAGTTLVLADGSYEIASTLRLSKSGLVLRSASDDPTKVIIDGRYVVNELVQVTASDVTIAHLTLTRAKHHPIHAFPPAAGVDVENTRIYGVVISDSGQQFVKVNPIQGQPGYVDHGSIECSSFRMTDAGRPNIESCCGGCYTGGIDVHAGLGWRVRNNLFEGIHCENGALAEHAVHFWKGSRDTLVENNRIVDCARGIGFGLDGGIGERVYPDAPYGGAMLAHYDGIIRNNVIWASTPWFDTGIELQIAKQPLVVHNTVLSADSVTSFFSSIDYRFPETFAVIQNNLTRKISQRDGAQGTVSHNLEATPLDLFADAAALDFHLLPSKVGAIDQGSVVPESGLDMDGQTHDHGAPDLGADEYWP